MKANFEGLILGAAVGDALGLPAEGLTPVRSAKRWRGIWRMRLLFGRGMVSDDTEHMVMVALCLLQHPNDATAFQKALARRLRWWFAALPPGTGLATARACIKLWLGFPPSRSGVFSAGNGPAMRSAIIGAFFAQDQDQREAYVRASTRLTHTDPKAQTAAWAIAETAAFIVRGGTEASNLLARLRELAADASWLVAMQHIDQALAVGEDVSAFVQRLDLASGVTGYAYHTVPVALYAWLRHRDDYQRGLESVLNCGGDTDTVGAIVGALLGLSSGGDTIPRAWLDGMMDWPLSVARLRQLARCFDSGAAVPFRSWHWLGMPVRNLFMLAVVLAHGFARLVR